jgi:phage-related protein|nr:MAG TPA: minor tail protein [Caudoviricetes sp.]
MAQADGSIIIDTEINSDGMSAGGREIESSLRKMANELNGVSAKTKASIEKQIDSFSKLSREYARQSEKVEELKRKVAEYGNQKIPTEEYREIQAQIDQATAKMNRLTEAQERFLANGGKKNSNTYKKQQYDIDELANTIKYAEGELKDLEASGTAFRTGTGTKEAKADMEKLAVAEDKLANINDRLNTSYKSIKGTVDEYKSKTLKASDANDKMSSSGNRASKSMKGVSKSAGGARMSLGRMLGMSLLMSVAFRAFSAVMSGIKGGFDNLSQYSSDTNNSLSMLWSSLVRLQNSLATAFAPILSIVAPILSKFIDMISTAASYVSMFFAFLSGKKTYTKAIAVQKDYAKSLDKTASSAKKDADSTKDVADATEDATDATEDYLSPLDDLNRYTEQQDKNNSGSKNPSSSTPNTGGGSGTSPMFEEVAISNGFSSLMDDILDKLKQIRDIFMSGFWDGLGDYKPMLEELQNDLISIGNHLKDIFTDENVQAAAQRFAKSFVYNLGRVVGSFASVGLTIAVNIVGGIESYLSENTERIKKWLIEMFDIGTDVNTIIGDLSTSVAYIFKQTFGTQTAQDLTGDILGIFMTAFGEAALLAAKAGKDILDALAKPIIDNKDDWVKAINDTLKPIEEVAQSIETFLQNVADRLTKLYDEHVNPFINDIGDGLTKIVDTLLTTYDEYIAPVLDNWAKKFDDVLNGQVGDAINQVLNVLGQLIDLLGVLWNVVLVPLIDWIIQNIVPILAPIVEWIGNTALDLIGTIAQVVSGIMQILSGLITFLLGVFTGDWGKAFDGLKQMATGLRDALNGIFNFIRDSIFKPISKFVKDVFKTDWTQAFGIIGDYMNGWAQNIKNISDSVKQIFNGIVNFVNGVLSGDWRRAWNGIKNIFAGIWNAMASVIKSPVNLIISFMNAMLRGFQRMQNGFASAMNHMNIRLPKWLQEFTGWSSVGFNIGYWSPNYIPYLAKGAVIPPNKEFMAVLGDQKNGNNIEAPESLIRQIVREESGSGQKQRIEIPVYLKGKQIYKAVVEEGKVVMSQTGMNPFEMA